MFKRHIGISFLPINNIFIADNAQYVSYTMEYDSISNHINIYNTLNTNPHFIFSCIPSRISHRSAGIHSLFLLLFSDYYIIYYTIYYIYIYMCVIIYII